MDVPGYRRGHEPRIVILAVRREGGHELAPLPFVRENARCAGMQKEQDPSAP